MLINVWAFVWSAAQQIAQSAGLHAWRCGDIGDDVQIRKTFFLALIILASSPTLYAWRRRRFDTLAWKVLAVGALLTVAHALPGMVEAFEDVRRCAAGLSPSAGSTHPSRSIDLLIASSWLLLALAVMWIRAARGRERVLLGLVAFGATSALAGSMLPSGSVAALLRGLGGDLGLMMFMMLSFDALLRANGTSAPSVTSS
jgi:hypothetical protein